MNKLGNLLILSFCIVIATLSGCTATNLQPSSPKYVFFFLGDGMSIAQVEAGQAFKAGDEHSVEAMLAPDNQLNMAKMPAMGMASTFCDGRFITDSAAAATAFASGLKTQAGVLGRNAAKDTSYRSIAELLQDRGHAVGIISSAPLSHATPAGYYANVNSRDNYCEIGYQAAQSGFDFFGGGLFPQIDSSNNTAKVVLQQAFNDAGYTTIRDRSEILALRDKQAGKVICSVATSHDGETMPFAIDNPQDDFTLAEITRVAINYLESDPEGFFIMVEGGKIDWACHANDIVATIHELLAFDDAIGVALDFLEQHPAETLIVVTGDHETGGLTLGFQASHYETDLRPLRAQTKSGERFIAEDLAAYRREHRWTSRDESNIDDDMKALIRSCFGLDWERLSEYQREELEKAYDATLGRTVADRRRSGYTLGGNDNVDYLSYGGKDPLTITITKMLARTAGLDWTTTSHTALPVPVFAAGTGAQAFSGFYDNTDIPKKMGQLLQLPPLPVEDPDRAGRSAY